VRVSCHLYPLFRIVGARVIVLEMANIQRPSQGRLEPCSGLTPNTFLLQQSLSASLWRPKRGVIALEGDGSILMMLGSLATIANVRPRNLTIIIWDNGIYQITGKQPTARAP
jgi:pyruvate/2-oxoacid:ferredoxin oxidoreductase beta subunit